MSRLVMVILPLVLSGLLFVLTVSRAEAGGDPYSLLKLIEAMIANEAIDVKSQPGNTTVTSFNKSKRNLRQVYTKLDKKTLYCDATFKGKVITDSNGFTTEKYVKRAKKLEWEHVVPAQFFGQHFKAWREGDPACVTSSGRHFKGRACASKVSVQYRYMQADMHNLFPSIGSVNAIRSNYRYADLDKPNGQYGDCQINRYNKEFRPPVSSRGIVGRTSLYFENAYDNYSLSDSQRKLFTAWSKLYPPTAQECKRNELIEKVQGNINLITKKACFKPGVDGLMIDPSTPGVRYKNGG